MKQTMGEIISTRRKELGMTQRELADEMGVALIVSSIMGEMTLHAGLTMCGIGLFCLSLKNFISQ